jgi:hypothetical protein
VSACFFACLVSASQLQQNQLPITYDVCIYDAPASEPQTISEQICWPIKARLLQTLPFVSRHALSHVCCLTRLSADWRCMSSGAGRAWRMGQQRKVTVKRFYVKVRPCGVFECTPK